MVARHPMVHGFQPMVTPSIHPEGPTALLLHLTWTRVKASLRNLVIMEPGILPDTFMPI